MSRKVSPSWRYFLWSKTPSAIFSVKFTFSDKKVFVFPKSQVGQKLLAFSHFFCKSFSKINVISSFNLLIGIRTKQSFVVTLQWLRTRLQFWIQVLYIHVQDVMESKALKAGKEATTNISLKEAYATNENILIKLI